MGRYRLDELLGEGGMGQVYRAWDNLMQQEYALKLIHPHLMLDLSIRQRFVQELALTQRLMHPGIVRSFALHRELESQLTFFTMELLQGHTLEQWFRQQTRLAEEPLCSPEQTLNWVLQLADILAYAHREGVIHRDLKPANVMLLPDGRLKLMDFGIAKALSGTHATLHTGFVGTVFYMAPEQMQGELEVSPATDVFALGVLTYQLLTGEIPLGRVIPPTRLVKGLNPVIDEVILKAIDPRPDCRYGKVLEFADALQRGFQGSVLSTSQLSSSLEVHTAGTGRSLQSTEIKEVFCPPGSFAMGSRLDDPESYGDERPLTQISLTRPFWMLSTPVTQGHWNTLMKNNPSYFQGDVRRPVEWISWYDAIAFCNALSRAEGLEEAYILKHQVGEPGASFVCEVEWKGPQSQGYRLPTEAEWEYACRAGSLETRYGPLSEIAWYRDNARQKTQPVTQKQPNDWGLSDMLGNVLEWCWDSWEPSLPGGTVQDPVRFNTSNNRRVGRGGSWLSVSRNCRAADRNWNVAGFRNNYLGFRVCRTA
jgi:serine/threonine protein kinase